MVFPRTISGRISPTVQVKVNSGFVKPEVFGYDSDTFCGGNSDKLGMNKETGLYLMLDKHNPERVLGTYIPALDTLTPMGRALVEEYFGDKMYAKPPIEKKPKKGRRVESQPANNAPVIQIAQTKAPMMEKVVLYEQREVGW